MNNHSHIPSFCPSRPGQEGLIQENMPFLPAYLPSLSFRAIEYNPTVPTVYQPFIPRRAQCDARLRATGELRNATAQGIVDQFGWCLTSKPAIFGVTLMAPLENPLDVIKETLTNGCGDLYSGEYLGMHHKDRKHIGGAL